MTAKRAGESSAESVVRANRQRLAGEDGAQPLADTKGRAIEIHLNVQRLRELRAARLAEDANAWTVVQLAREKRSK